MVIGTVTLPLSFDGRRLPVCCGVMVNGSTGCCDVLIGNFHMRHDWNFDMNSKQFIVKTPPDSNGNLVIPLDWRLASSKDVSAQDASNFAFMA